jgi:hypothetical protein
MQRMGKERGGFRLTAEAEYYIYDIPYAIPDVAPPGKLGAPRKLVKPETLTITYGVLRPDPETATHRNSIGKYFERAQEEAERQTLLAAVRQSSARMVPWKLLDVSS